MALKAKLLLFVFGFSLLGVFFVGLITYHSSKSLNVSEMLDLLAASTEHLGTPLTTDPTDVEGWQSWFYSRQALTSSKHSSILFDRYGNVVAAAIGEESGVTLEYIRKNSTLLRTTEHDASALQVKNVQLIWQRYNLAGGDYTIIVFFHLSADRFERVFRELLLPTSIAGGIALWASVWATIILGNVLTKTRQEEFRRAQANLEWRIVERTAKLSESEAQLRAVGDSSPGAIAIRDLDGRNIIVNNLFCDWFGIDHDDIINQRMSEFLLPEHLDGIEAQERQALDTQETVQAETDLQLPGGVIRHVTSQTFPIHGSDNAVFAVGTILNDFTLLKRTEDALRNSEEIITRSIETVEFANRAKTEFLANMSHELRTPLNAILGFSDMIKGELFGPHTHEKYKEYGEAIHLSGNHLLQIIGDILDISKIESGEVNLEESEVDVKKTIFDCITMIQARADNAQIQLTVDMPPDTPNLRTDQRHLKQILINLLSNAVKFTDTGGNVFVTVGLDDEQRMEVRVADTGVGIAKHL